MCFENKFHSLSLSLSPPFYTHSPLLISRLICAAFPSAQTTAPSSSGEGPTPHGLSPRGLSPPVPPARARAAAGPYLRWTSVHWRWGAKQAMAHTLISMPVWNCLFLMSQTPCTGVAIALFCKWQDDQSENDGNGVLRLRTVSVLPTSAAQHCRAPGGCGGVGEGWIDR